MTLTVALLVLAVCVLVQALFAGYETGFVSLNPLRIRHISEAEGKIRAKRLLHYAGKPDQMLAVLLIGTNIATIVATIALTRAIGPVWAFVIAAPVFLIFSEIIPKSIFRAHPNRLSLAFLPIVEACYVLLSPIAAPIAWVTGLVFRGKGQHISPLMKTREDVRVLVDESADHGNIEPEEQRMIHSVINLQATQAKEIMVPRIDMQALPEDATNADLLQMLAQTGRTRIPIYRESVDTVIGVITTHDVLLDPAPDEGGIARFIRPVLHVPDTMKVDDLFQEMKQAKQHMAVVTDEYGGTDGLVTLEDILEEIFGDIQDEHDREESQIHLVGPGAYVIDARTYLEDVSEAIHHELRDPEVETIGGWLMRVAGRIPVQGEVVSSGKLRITVLDGTASSINKIRLEVLPDSRDIDA
ncbi:MAG TPA: hemolysin family protein [Candidatus Hydrogenedentes bacterium]|nr:hemolysin family protein [Candidatus Hydrogenedentota bacterium]HRK35028.1 hemolysin family protein [Candidatus Hydrogenedentota bacterium]